MTPKKNLFQDLRIFMEKQQGILGPDGLLKLISGLPKFSMAFGIIILVSVICSSCNLKKDEQRTSPSSGNVSEQFTSTDIKPGMFPLDELIQKAEFVFEGKVEKITYRESIGNKDHNPIIHTFITYSVESIYCGKADNEKFFTLRFIGGPTSDSTVLMVPEFPTFDIGDRDILFVSQNGKNICPLVLKDRGRIRIIDGKIYDEYGYSIGKNSKGVTILGFRKDFEQTIKHRIGNIELERKYSENHDKEVLGKNDLKDIKPFNYSDFVDHLNQKIKSIKENTVVAKSADQEKPFDINITNPKPFKEETR